MKRYTRKKKSFNKNNQKISKRHLFIGGDDDHKCVYVKLGCGTDYVGLGNQLFVYAAGIIVKNRTGLPLCLIRGKHNPHSQKNYTTIFKQGSGLNILNTNKELPNAKKIHEGLGLYNKWTNKNIPINKSHDILLAGGYYHNYASVKPALPIMRKDFSDEFNKLYPKFKDQVVPNKTACMHIRRGDFVSRNWLTPLEYYQKALALLDGIKDIDTLYIVSEDIEWCKQQPWATTKKIIYFDDPDEIKTLYLMMLCKGAFILSTMSTYGAWGAMLGADGNPQSTIIYLKEWGINLMFPSRWKGI